MALISDFIHAVWRPIAGRFGLSAPHFVFNHLVPNQPVVVTDALQEWRATQRWTPQFFKDRFGAFRVMLEDDKLKDSQCRSLAHYIEQFKMYECRDMLAARQTVPYLRYSTTEDGDLTRHL